jgi:uncharacterized protein
MVPQQDIVLLFTRYPEPGLSKTRLIPILGDQGAADLQRRMTEGIVERISHLAAGRPLSLEIHFDGGDHSLMSAWLGKSRLYKQQEDSDLGSRMACAIAAHLRTKEAIVLTGSDCPEITSILLAEALEALRREDMVIGPACDGGYYLIGVNGGLDMDTVSSLFTDIPWGSKTVFADTMARAELHQLTCHILPELHDIDRPEDLRYINHHPDLE